MIYDDEIRYFLSKNKTFKTELKDNALRIDEYKILNSRIDIAVINGLFVGYEIKGKNDTLEKLEKQVKDYLHIFDKLSIIIDKKHLSKAKDLIPSCVGIILTERGFPVEKDSTLNIDINYTEIAYLLWKEELLEHLLKSGIKKIKSKGRYELAEIFASTFKDNTSPIVREAIRCRFTKGWRNEKESIWDKYLKDPSLVYQQ